MAQREIRRWIARPPAHVFAAVCAQVLSFGWLGGSRHCAIQPACGAAPCVGGTAICRLRQGVCRMRVTNFEPGHMLALDLSESGRCVQIRIQIEPRCDGTLVACEMECEGVLPPAARSVLALVFRAFGYVLGDLKGALERDGAPALRPLAE